MELFGSTRSRVERDHALICPESFVRSPLPGWSNTQCVILIAPPMGARFMQYLAFMEPGATAAPPAAGIERFLFVLEGQVNHHPAGSSSSRMTAGDYAYIPPDDETTITAGATSKLVVFEKRYAKLPGVQIPPRFHGPESAIAGLPFMGDPDARLQTLLPDNSYHDLAVNLFRFQPGAALPLVEIHVMEHGLLMLEGQGVYRLGEKWYPVRAGDVIWMKSFCPQWFVAMGNTPAAYLYYKDVNRDPLGGQA